nr:MAG: anti-anti-sigma factor [Chloroflexota bacterium]
METRTVPAKLESLALVSEFIADAAARLGLDDHTAWQVQLAVDEAATNIIQHGYDPEEPGVIELAWRVDGPDLVVTLRDYGRRFDPEQVPPPDLTSPLEERQAGGLGLYLMNRLMDSVQFDFDDQRGNLLTMKKRIGPVAPEVQVLELGGRLDAVHTQQAISPVSAAVAAGARFVLLDLGAVTFMSSTGLRALLLVRKELLNQGGQLRLCNLQPQVLEVFTLTGFTQVFAIHTTREEALRAFGQESP